MERRRILLVDMSLMLREIVRSVVAPQPDLELVAELTNVRPLRRAIRRHRPDVVIGDSHSTRHEIEIMLAERPTMKLLEVEDDGRASFLYELRLQRKPLGEISPSRLLEAIRA